MEFGANIGRVLLRVLLAFGFFPWISRKVFGQRISTIAAVTLRSTVRFKLFPALLLFLLLTVVVLPLVIKDDGTARGLTQILLTYTLGISVTLLGFSTLWLSCGVLAREIEDCTIQTLAVKPVARWQIWIGKWLGIMALNLILLTFTGLAVYSSVLHRADRLSEEQKEILKNYILIGRGSVKAPIPDLEGEVQQMYTERRKEPTIAAMDPKEVMRHVRTVVKGQNELVPPRMGKRWPIDFSKIKNFMGGREMQVRIKFNKGVLTQITSFPIMLQVGPPGDPRMIRLETALTDDNYHDLPVGKDLLDANGILNVEFYNMSPVPLSVPIEDGVEALYYESGFGLNFIRGLIIIFLWLALLAALGLAAASYMSFPVAAFFSLASLVVVLSSGVMESVVNENTLGGVNHETGKANASSFDSLVVPMFYYLLKFINLIKEFSPIDFLSNGRSVSWGILLAAIGQIGLLITGITGAIGIALFYCRELASAQQTS